MKKSKKRSLVLTQKNLSFVQGTGKLQVITTNAISPFETVRDILTVYTTAFVNGKRIIRQRPLFIPVNIHIPVEQRKAALKEFKKGTRKICGVGYRPAYLGHLSDGQLIRKEY